MVCLHSVARRQSVQFASSAAAGVRSREEIVLMPYISRRRASFAAGICPWVLSNLEQFRS